MAYFDTLPWSRRQHSKFGELYDLEAVKVLAYTLKYQERIGEAIISYERVLSVYRELLLPNHEKMTDSQDYDKMLDKMKAKSWKGRYEKDEKEGDGIEQVANETEQELDLHT
jgi:hypothetical protein